MLSRTLSYARRNRFALLAVACLAVIAAAIWVAYGGFSLVGGGTSKLPDLPPRGGTIDGTRTVILGAIAGFTIFIGLPLGRMRSLSARWRAFLGVLSAGILLFIFWDVLTQTHDILEGALTDARAGGAWGPFALRAVMVIVGFSVGAFGLAWVEAIVLRRRRPAPIAGASVLAAGEAGLDTAALARRAERGALTLGMLIALAIGLHNFSEGLAIGVSARAGEIGLATTLIAGFALHNATEGFGIVGPLSGVRPSWRWLALAGLIGGGPTFLGTLIGFHVSSAPLELAFYALAAGAILYVVGELWGAARGKLGKNLVLGGIVLGFLLGLASDLVITYGGG